MAAPARKAENTSAEDSSSSSSESLHGEALHSGGEHSGDSEYTSGSSDGGKALQEYYRVHKLLTKLGKKRK
jgi:hypothetical protein